MDNTTYESQINSINAEIAQLQEKLKELNEELELLEEFKIKCNQHTEAFDTSMAIRRQRLSAIEEFTRTVRSARSYYDRMDFMLSGDERSSAVSAITELHSSIDGRTTAVKDEIIEIEDRIRNLGNRIETIQFEFEQFRLYGG